jgi:hypothetical protein
MSEITPWWWEYTGRHPRRRNEISGPVSAFAALFFFEHCTYIGIKR